jgi:hypothetical protein
MPYPELPSKNIELFQVFPNADAAIEGWSCILENLVEMN